MTGLLDALSLHLDGILLNLKARAQRRRLRQFPQVHPSVIAGPGAIFIGPPESFYIGERTYINDAIISAGRHSHVHIGRRCAIGYRVSIKALTHDPDDPCPDENGRIRTVERDIRIGDCCWIGDNVFINAGVTIGDNVIIGANSVVTRSFPDDVVIAGSPARVLRPRSEPVTEGING